MMIVMNVPGITNNLHVVLVLDFDNPMFQAQCENNPGLYTRCDVVWCEGWSSETTKSLPRLILAR